MCPADPPVASLHRCCHTPTAEGKHATPHTPTHPHTHTLTAAAPQPPLTTTRPLRRHRPFVASSSLVTLSPLSAGVDTCLLRGVCVIAMADPSAPRRSGRERHSLQPTLNESALTAELRDGERALARRSRKTVREEQEEEYRAAQTRNGTAGRESSRRKDAEDDDEQQDDDEEEDGDEQEEEEEADETEKRATARKPRQRAVTSGTSTPRRARQRAQPENGNTTAGSVTATPARKRGRPPGGTPSSARTSTPSSSSSRRPALSEDKPQPEEEQFTRLWHSIARSGQSVKVMTRQLVDQYTSSSVREQRQAKADLINFLLEAIGSVSGLTVSEVLQLDDESDMSGLLERYEDSGMIVHADAPVRRIKKFESRLSAFMQRLYADISIERLTSDPFLHTTLPALVISFSRSQIRSYRLTMTVACAGMMSGLVAQAVEMERQLETAKEQLQAAEGRRTKPATGLLQQLRDQVKELSSNLSFLHSLLKKLVDSVIIHRYRDVDEHIRSLTLTTLTSCIQQYPAYFCDDTHLRYVGWLLSDKQPMVRRAAISGLVTLYSSATVDMVRRFQTFTDRFMPRFNEMCEDVDDGVAAAAVEFFTVLLRIEMLEEQQGSHVPVLMWDENQHVRKAAAAFVYQDTFASSGERNEDDEEAEAKRSEADLTQCTNIFHHYCPMFKRARDKASEQRGSEQKGKRQTEHEHTVPLNRRVLVHGSAVSELRENDMQQSMDVMVEGLFGQVAALRDWTTIYNMIRAGEEDDKKKAGRGRSKRQSAKGKAEETEKSSDKSKLTLIHLLLACTKRVMALAESTKDKKEREEREEAASILSLFLIDHLSALLTMYLSSPQPLSLLLRLLSYIRFGDYHTHRKHSAFTQLLVLLKKIMTSSVDESVLVECGLAWRQLVKDNSSYEQEAQHALDELAMELRETVRQEWEGVAAADSQVDVGRAAKELLEDEEKVTSMLAVCKRILSLSKPLHLLDIAYSSPQLYHIYHELLPVLADRRYQASPTQQDLLLCVLRILFADSQWRLAELDRTSPSRSEVERLTVQRNDLCSLLHRLLEHSEVYEVRDVCFSLTSDVFVMFSGRLAGGVLNELALNRERVNTLSRAFDDYFRQLMDGSDVEARMQQERAKRVPKDGEEAEEEPEAGSSDADRTNAYISDMRVRAMLAASHVVCYDHNAPPTFSMRQSTFIPQLRHELLTASFLSHFLSADDECLPIVKQVMQLLRSYSVLLLLQCQLVTLLHQYEHHANEEEVRALAFRFAQSWPPAHSSFLPLLRAAMMYACEDPPTRLTFLDVITPYINKASREDAMRLQELSAQQRSMLADMKGDETTVRPKDKERWHAIDRFIALIAKKTGKATAAAARRMESVAEEGEEMEEERERTDESRTPRRSAGETSILLTPTSRRTPTTAESTRSIVSLGLSPVREVREEEDDNKAAPSSRKRGRLETEEEMDGGGDEEQTVDADEELEEDDNEEAGQEAEEEPSRRREKRSKASNGVGRGRGRGRGKGKGRTSR